MYDENNNDYELEWDSPIENDSPEFILLPEGEYEFTVKSYERKRHEGSAKLPPCKKAEVFFEIITPEGETSLRDNLFLHSKCEGTLCSFFTSIGQRKRGERFTPNWPAIVGATGRAKIGVREYTTDKGEKRTTNEIKRYLEPEDKPTSPVPTAQAAPPRGKF